MKIRRAFQIVLTMLFGVAMCLTIVCFAGEPIGQVFGLEHVTALGVGLGNCIAAVGIYYILRNYDYVVTQITIRATFIYMTVWSKCTHNRVLSYKEIEAFIIQRTTHTEEDIHA